MFSATPISLTLSAEDLLDGDLYRSQAFALVAKDVLLLLDDSVETMDVPTLIDCLCDLRAMGFCVARAADVRRKAASTLVARAGRSLPALTAVPA